MSCRGAGCWLVKMSLRAKKQARASCDLVPRRGRSVNGWIGKVRDAQRLSISSEALNQTQCKVVEVGGTIDAGG